MEPLKTETPRTEVLDETAEISQEAWNTLPTPNECCTWISRQLRATGFFAYADRVDELLVENKNLAPHRARAFEFLLQEARDYILNKAGRHDLNWRDGHAIIERVDAVMNMAPQAPAALRVLFEGDVFCPNCGHNRDTSSVSTVILNNEWRKCQMCEATWSEI